MLRKTLILVLAIAPLLSAQNERITIARQSSYGGKKSVLNAYALLYAKLGDDDQVLLSCELSHEDCTQLALGQYEIARLIPGEGSYKDCPNVDIYRIGANRLKEKPLGEYCLDHLQNSAGEGSNYADKPLAKSEQRMAIPRTAKSGDFR